MASIINAGTTTLTPIQITGDTSGILQLQTNGGTTAVTIDTSQNVGIQTTPSAWSANRPTIELGGSVQGTIAFNGNNSNGGLITYNSYYNGSATIYKNTGYACNYIIGTSSGSHVWTVAPSGTAGATVSSTTALTLDNNGNLGLGVTPSAWGLGHALQVSGSTGFLGFSGVNGNIVTNSYYDGSNYKYIANGYVELYAQSAGQHQWYTAPSGTAGATVSLTQAMTLDNSGNLFGGNATTGTSLSNTNSWILQPSSFYIQHISGTSTGAAYMNFVYNASSIGSITQSGTTGVLYNITSDRRLKTNIEPLTNSGAIIDALLPRKFNWTTDNSADMGFVTDEYQNVFPDAITGEPNATKEEEYEITPAVKDSMGNITTPAVMGTRTVPVYQMGDFSTSAQIAVLVAEVQSLRARLKAANIA